MTCLAAEVMVAVVLRQFQTKFSLFESWLGAESELAGLILAQEAS